jgi:uncharacterized MAPEG superfamily protein
MHLHAALITALTAIVFMASGFLVARARGRYGIQAPATTGHPDFDRTFRAQMNTLEQMALFLPVLWLATLYGNEQQAAWLGYAWLVGRVLYIAGYVSDSKRRGPGFMIGMLALTLLLVMALRGIVTQML